MTKSNPADSMDRYCSWNIPRNIRANIKLNKMIMSVYKLNNNASQVLYY